MSAALGGLTTKNGICEARIPLKVVTIGLYGFNEQSFLRALLAARVDIFCDVRYRRGVRGSTYAFANSRRLQTLLADHRIRYLHRKDLAPTMAVRSIQAEFDQRAGTAKRKRTQLSDAFVNSYQVECLSSLDSYELLNDFGPSTRVAALFCVETLPRACHRSLIASKIAKDTGIEVEDIRP